MTGIRLPLCTMPSALLYIVFILQNQDIIFGLFLRFYRKESQVEGLFDTCRNKYEMDMNYAQGSKQ